MVGALVDRGLVAAKRRRAVDVLLKSVPRIVEPLREEHPDVDWSILATCDSDESAEVSARQIVVGRADLLLHGESRLTPLVTWLPRSPVESCKSEFREMANMAIHHLPLLLRSLVALTLLAGASVESGPGFQLLRDLRVGHADVPSIQR